MKRLVAAFLLLAAAAAAAAPAQPVVFIVRHAEKAATGGNDPDLSPAGQARADTLARMLKDSGIVSIFASEFKRTKETAAPTAKSLGLIPTIVPAKDTAALASKLRELKGNALVVGHGNIIPDLVKTLGIDTPIQIDESDYSQVFVVILGDKPQLLRLRYPMWSSFS
jgi:broad specificity phosphatase PhoE